MSGIDIPRPIVFVVTCLISEPPLPFVGIVAAFDTEEAAGACLSECVSGNKRPTDRFFMHQVRIETDNHAWSEAP